MRAPGMSLDRMPLFVWAMVVTSFMIMFAMPAVMLASTMLITDRLVGTHFFNPAEGGDPLLWQHLFWFFGHPEVYIIFIPGTRDRLGDRRDVRAPAGVRLYGDGAVAHRDRLPGVRALGAPHVRDQRAGAGQELLHRREHDDRDSDRRSRSSAGSRRCGVAGRCSRHRCCSCWASSSSFVIGGLTGVMLASVAARPAGARHVLRRRASALRADRRRACFRCSARSTTGFRRSPGGMLSERLGKMEFLALLHRRQRRRSSRCTSSGSQGMPRRIYTYAGESGWGPLNIDVVHRRTSDRREPVALRVQRRTQCITGAECQWIRGEGARSNGPRLRRRPPHNFDAMPVVGGREPLWESNGIAGSVVNLGIEGSRGADNERGRSEAPPPRTLSVRDDVAVLSAIGTTILFIASIFTPWAVVWGSPLVALLATCWWWPSLAEARRHREVEVASQ